MKRTDELFELTKAHHSSMSKYVIDIGARDISSSNLRPFIEQDYRALLVEPNPFQTQKIYKEMFSDEFVEYTNNNGIKLSTVAIGDHIGTTKFIASPEVGHSRIPNENFNRNKWQTKGQQEIQVEMITFQILLNAHKEWKDASVVDIDTEGYDTVVLRSLFETECRPEFIMIEDWNDPIIIKEQEELFNENHYVMFSDKINHSKIYKKIL